jgi:oligopeptide transport system substrate-binding protein
VQAVDDLTLVVELEEPTSYFLQLLTYVVTFPVPRHVVDVAGEIWSEMGNLVTNGPFKLVEWKQNNPALFDRNPAYHGLYNGNLECVQLSFTAEQRKNLLLMYEEEELDFLYLHFLNPVVADRARQMYAEEYASGPQLVCYYVGFNVSHPPLNDIRVRYALALAISRERLASITYRGLIFPATGGLVPPGMPGHSPDIAAPYDPEQARALMADVGYPDGHGFEGLECLARDTPLSRTMADFLKAQWLQILGIDITLKFVESGKFLDLTYSKSQKMWLSGFMIDYPDPDSVFRVEDVIRLSGWQNIAFIDLVEEARKVMDQEARMKLYQQADRIVVEEAPVIPLAYGRFHMLVKPWVKKLNFSAVNPPFWKDIVIEPH